MRLTLKGLGKEFVPVSIKVIVDNCGLIIPTLLYIIF